MTRIVTLYLVVVALSAMTIPGVSTAQEDGCQRFTLTSTGENRVVAFHDEGDTGVSVGDMRVGVRSLIDDDGKPAGTYRWYILPIDPVAKAGETGAAIYRGYFLLADGMIMTETVYEPVSAVENTGSVSVTNGERAVVAGTGKYRSPRGYMIETVVERYGDSGLPLKKTFEFVLNCDEAG